MECVELPLQLCSFVIIATPGRFLSLVWEDTSERSNEQIPSLYSHLSTFSKSVPIHTPHPLPRCHRPTCHGALPRVFVCSSNASTLPQQPSYIPERVSQSAFYSVPIHSHHMHARTPVSIIKTNQQIIVHLFRKRTVISVLYKKSPTCDTLTL